MKVLVCGGRAYRNRGRVITELEKIKPTCVITGGADGADRFAYDWAYENGIACPVFYAAWSYHGPQAGPIRNGWMLKFGQPDLVLAFPGGQGTENMIKLAIKAGVPVTVVIDSPRAATDEAVAR